MGMERNVLQAMDVHKSYRQANNILHVLKGISLNIEEGEIISIVGPSGAGKSTLLHILGGLDRPDEGKVMIEEDDIYRQSDAKRAYLRNRKIGFVFQFYHLLPEFTALENVILPLLIKKDHGKFNQILAKGKDLLERVGLVDRRDHRPHQLSGGEQQRVAIARALINEPKIIVCDEPTGNLDSEKGKEIIDLLFAFNKKNHQTLVIVTHDEQIAQFSHRTLHMRDGKLM